MSSKFEALVEDGIALCRRGLYKEAIQIFHEAEAMDLNTSLLYNRSKANFKLGNYSDSLSDLDHLVSLQPENPEWYGERAVLYHYLKRKSDALGDLDTAVNLDSSNGFRYSSRAFIKDFYGDHKGAISDYEKAIEIDPEDAISYNNKGLVEEKLGHKRKAQSSFKIADGLIANSSEDNTELREEKAPVHHSSTTTDSSKPTKNSLTLEFYFNTLKDVLGSRKGARSFLNYFLGKKEKS